MRFKFCGESDCPDWILAEINTLSRISSVKLKQLAQIVAKSLTSPTFDKDKAEKLLQDSKLDKDIDLKTSIACITFILESAANFNCDPGVFSSELQQLGLPREHSQSIRKILTDNCAQLTENLQKKSLRVSPLKNVNITENSDGCGVNIQMDVGGRSIDVIIPEHVIEQMSDDIKRIEDIMNDIDKQDFVY